MLTLVRLWGSLRSFGSAWSLGLDDVLLCDCTDDALCDACALDTQTIR